MAWFTPRQPTLPELIENNGQWLADKPALEVGDTRWTWRDFAAETARVAHALARDGVQPGQRVAVLMENSAEMMLAMFGTIRAGAVAVPLNVSISDAAVATMIADSNAQAVFASAQHVPRIDALRDALPRGSEERLIAADGASPGWQAFARWLEGASAEPPAVRTTPEDECNIIYSSGTTGTPKGIVHDHRARSAWAYDMAVGLRYHAGARTLCSLGLYSNISWVAMLATMLAGGTIVVMPRFDARGCLELIADARITHTTVVPVQLQRMLEVHDFEQHDLSSLYSVMCCGSPLPLTYKQRIVDALGPAFMELYGLTEGLVTILSPEDMTRKTESVGLPCPGQQLRILDNDDAECATGEAGEIVGRGPLLMAGYHNRPEANAEATWTDADGVRWLRTGDIGKLDEDGFLYLVDRKKDMIISGGQNIYPADIESVIASHDAVREVAVIGAPSSRWGETPLAVVATRDAVDGDSLQAWVNSRVGKQQRIAGVRFVDALPRNPNGKVLKRELRKVYDEVLP
ncbi:MAG: AMP-binding protein [Pseudomonadota bacterium]